MKHKEKLVYVVSSHEFKNTFDAFKWVNDLFEKEKLDDEANIYLVKKKYKLRKAIKQSEYLQVESGENL